jgi:hypothetical protein
MHTEIVEATPTEAALIVHQELAEAAGALHAGHLDRALDGYIRALGLALQLGPAPAQEALTSILQAAHRLARQQDAKALSTLGPALIELVDQVGDADALPATPVMEAWSSVASDIGTLIGQVGLALTTPPHHRVGMLAAARSRATLLDTATNGLFDLTDWLDALELSS